MKYYKAYNEKEDTNCIIFYDDETVIGDVSDPMFNSQVEVHIMGDSCCVSEKYKDWESFLSADKYHMISEISKDEYALYAYLEMIFREFWHKGSVGGFPREEDCKDLYKKLGKQMRIIFREIKSDL